MKKPNSIIRTIKAMMPRSVRRFMMAIMLSIPTLFAIPARGNGQDEKKNDKNPIGNFGKVNDHIYRGEKPGDDEYDYLASMGIKTVIDLRKQATPKSKTLAEKAGLKYNLIRLDDTVAPTKVESDLFLSLVEDKNNWPVYVHCKGGKHRTGVLIALYRMEKEGWNSQQAYEEMKEFNFYTIFGHKPLKEFVFNYQPTNSGQ